MFSIPTRFTRHAALLCGLAIALASTIGAARTLDTAHGEVEIEGTPQRVVTLFEGALDAAVALGTTPVAAVSTRGANGVARYMRDRVGDIDIVGTARETNIEAVIAQQPDLILGPPGLPEQRYRLLSRIAPTVVPATSGYEKDAWKQHTRLYGAALDASDRAEARIEAYEKRAADIAARVPEANDATVVRWMPQGPIVMARTIFSGRVLADAGFDVDSDGLVAEGRAHTDPLSLENLDRIDHDWLFIATLNAEGDDALANARQSPAFMRLDVVQSDRVIAVDGQLWSSASGPVAADAMLGDIADALEASAP